MRFPQVPIGQHFVFQGERYTKTGPMTADRDRDGVARMIPRSAAVLPADGTGTGPGRAAGEDPAAPWSAALDAYEDALRGALGGPDAVIDDRLAAALTAARAAFAAALR